LFVDDGISRGSSSMNLDSAAVTAAVGRDRRLYTIDWQWLGLGVGAVDVAYFVYTSLCDGAIDDSRTAYEQEPHYGYHSVQELQLLHHYFRTLSHRLLTQSTDDYRRESSLLEFRTFEQQYVTNVLYFFIFCVKNKFSSMTAADFERYAADAQDGRHLRSLTQARRLLERSACFAKHLNHELLRLHVEQEQRLREEAMQQQQQQQQ
jgi:hypothetical protein